MSGYAFRQATRTDLPAVHAFLTSHFEKWRADRDLNWLTWQYADNPAGFDICLCEKDGVLVGLSGFVPCRVRIDGVLRSAAFSTNTIVDARHRGQHVGQRLHQARLERYDVALSSGQSAANRAVYEKLAFVKGGQYRKLLVHTRFPKLSLKPRTIRDLYSWVRWSSTNRIGSDLQVRIEESPPQVDDALYEERFEHDTVGPLWNRSHLVWRYARHPYIRYRFASVINGSRIIALAVIRKGKDAGTVLTDFFSRPADWTAALTALGGSLEPPVMGQFVGRSLERRFKEAGWTSFVSTNQLLGRSLDASITDTLAAGRWCFFGGDSDADR